MKNNQAPPPPPLQQTNLIYEYKCPIGECEHQNNSYIGLTTTTLSRRLTMHLQQGGPKHHTQNHHNTPLTRDMLVKNTNIIARETNYNRLHILEALLIHKQKPPLNNQFTGTNRTLKLYSNTWPPHSGVAGVCSARGGVFQVPPPPQKKIIIKKIVKIQFHSELN